MSPTRQLDSLPHPPSHCCPHWSFRQSSPVLCLRMPVSSIERSTHDGKRKTQSPVTEALFPGSLPHAQCLSRWVKVKVGASVSEQRYARPIYRLSTPPRTNARLQMHSVEPDTVLSPRGSSYRRAKRYPMQLSDDGCFVGCSRHHRHHLHRHRRYRSPALKHST